MSNTSQFTLNSVGDTVFDRIKGKVGIIESIDYKANTAIVKVTDSNEMLVSKLFNLQKVKAEVADETKTYYKQVTEFHKAFDHPAPDKPTPLTLERAIARKIWNAEENVEFLHGSSDNAEEFNKAVDEFIQGVERARTKSLLEEFPKNDTEKLVAQVDAGIDGLYFGTGDFTEMNIDPDAPFSIVQDSNMSKLFTDSEGNKYAQYRESDGKILKSPEFFPPEAKLEEEIKRQMNK